MGEYGRTVGQSSGIAGGGDGSGDFNVSGDDVFDAFSGLIDGVAALPAEILIVAAAILIIGGLVFSFRT